MPPTLRGARSEGGSRDEGRRRTDDEGRGRGTRKNEDGHWTTTTRDEGRGTRDEGRGTRDEEKRGRTTEDDDDDDDEGRGTRDEFRARFVSALYLRDRGKSVKIEENR